MREFDFDEELKACEKKQRSDEIIAYTVGVGRVVTLLTDSRATKRAIEKAMETITKMEGFLGVTPTDIWHNLLLFDSLNNAKRCRNVLISEGVSVANYIVPCLVNKMYLQRKEG